MTISAATNAEDEFTTETRYVRAKTGQTVTRSGKALVYTGYPMAWASFRAADPDKDGMREVMFVNRNQREMSGRWFTGAYDETGIDVKLPRIGNDPLRRGRR